MRTFGYWLRRSSRWIAIDVVSLAIMLLVVTLNHVAVSEWIYGVGINFFLILVLGGVDYVTYARKHQNLCRMREVIQISVDALELPTDVIEADYEELIRLVHRDKMQQMTAFENKKTDMTEYYTMWMHQIKTPIAAMRLLLQSEDHPSNPELSEELFRIEQYVEMALQYLRLDSDTSDLLIQRYELDDIIREAVRKYAKLFIRKKIRLNYEAVDMQVLTDEKWLEFVIEQVLSNAIKYTPSGSISIYKKPEEKQVLVIEDTGIGIRAEDLPRVCERGYTGYNGHTDKRSTGIGLYLCKQILKKLSHEIWLESGPGQGTKVYIRLDVTERVHE